jgi:hypothetical protein
MPSATTTTLRFAPLASVLALACSTAPAPANDAGVVIPDVGPADAGGDLDGGPPDAGDGTCDDLSLVPFGTPALSPACLPRCTHATDTAVRACADAACADAARAADPTPPAHVRTMYGVFEIACGFTNATQYPCYLWQLYSCYETYCRTQFYAFSDCRDRGGACTTEQGAIDTCMNAMPEAVACETDRVASCYATSP